MKSKSHKLKVIDYYQVWQSKESFQIRGARKSMVLNGEVVKTALPKVLALLDGSYCEDEIVSKLSEQDNAELLLKILNALRQRELLEEIIPVPQSLSDCHSEKLHALANHFKNTSTNTWQPIVSLQEKPIIIFGQAELVIPIVINLSSCFARSILVVSDKINKSDIAHSRYLDDSDLDSHPVDIINKNLNSTSKTTVSIVEYKPESLVEWRQLLRESRLAITAFCKPILFNAELDAFNKAILSENVRWLPLAVIENKELQIGPSVVPTETACYKCYEYRFRSNFNQLESYDHFAQTFNAMQDTVDFGVLAPFAELVANYAAVEAIKLLNPEQIAASAGKMLSISLDTLSSQQHPVLRIPRCPHCNEYSERCPERTWG